MRLIPRIIFCFIAAPAVFGASPTLTPANVSIGKNLQTYATVVLSEPAAADVQLTIASTDPARLLVSKLPDTAGSPSITVNVKARYRESPEFWLQALADTGEVKYTANAAGYTGGAGVAALSPSGVAIIGPLGDSSNPEFVTTPRGWPTKIVLRTVKLDSSLGQPEPQYVRGGFSAEVELLSSDAAIGRLGPSRVSIPAASDSAATQFAPARVGKTIVTVNAAGFRVPVALNRVIATVKAPGMAVADDLVVGENLQLAVALSLGEAAPEGGVKVTLTSSDPKKLILAGSRTEVGKPSIEVYLPAGGVSTTYYVQALAPEGDVKHTAAAEGYTARTGTLTLAPSGVILCLQEHGPPDEAELFRPESAGSKRNNVVALLSENKPTPLTVYTAYLDPKSRRSADITVQELRAGLSLTANLKNSHPPIGTVASTAVIKGGSDRGTAEFKPLAVGQTVVSVDTPQGFTTPTNATELLVIVRE